MRLIRSLSFALLATVAGASASSAQILTITLAPPILPVYEQPPLPGPGYIWTPGYWAYGDDGYFWVPGTWVQPPSVGLLWTPGYWGWHDGIYAWNAGYWGPHVGFYGGVNYGFGYVGTGYEGGYWRGGVFSYNRTVNNFGSVHITNVYNKTVINNVSVNRVSFNGGTGGLTARPSPQQMAFAKEQHTAPTALQTQHQQTASSNPELRASVNHGSPSVAATSSPGQFSGHGVVGAKAATGVEHNEHAVGTEHNEHAVGTQHNEHAVGTQHNEHAVGTQHNEHAVGAVHTEQGHQTGGAPAQGNAATNRAVTNVTPHNPPAPHAQPNRGGAPVHAAAMTPRAPRPAPHPAPRPAPHPGNKPGQH